MNYPLKSLVKNMARKSEFFRKIYFVDNPGVLSSKQMDSLVMCSTKNWNYYFSDLGKKPGKEVILKEISNVELVEFDSKKAMFSFMDQLDNKSLLDFSLEHDKPCILRFV